MITLYWTCEGCGRVIEESQADMIVDHVQDCDLVDDAGHKVNTRIVSETYRGKRIVEDTEVDIVEVVWNSGGCSFEVYTVEDDVDLTIDGSFDTCPTDEQISLLLKTSE